MKYITFSLLFVALVIGCGSTVVDECHVDGGGEGGGPPRCMTFADCPGTVGECSAPVCVQEYCATYYAPPLTKCDGGTCNGFGHCNM